MDATLAMDPNGCGLMSQDHRTGILSSVFNPPKKESNDISERERERERKVVTCVNRKEASSQEGEEDGSCCPFPDHSKHSLTSCPLSHNLSLLFFLLSLLSLISLSLSFQTCLFSVCQ